MSSTFTEAEIVSLVDNLPSIKELRKQLEGAELLAAIYDKIELNEELELVRKEIDRIVAIVSRFYSLLGNRNWIFSDSLNLDRIEEIIATNLPDEAEKRMIDYLKDKNVLAAQINRLNRFPDMRPRIPLLNKAVEDFLNGRYYSTVLVIISVMDGFTNDMQKRKRKGLHARSPEELTSIDSVATIPVGLPSAQEVFTRSVHARVDEETRDILRHGIMHGMITNYDNPHIAAKAWCHLFAICDWAEDITRDHGNQNSFEYETPEQIIDALYEAMDTARKTNEIKKRLDDWKPHYVNLNSPAKGDATLFDDCCTFFESWKNKNYGKLSNYLPNFVNNSPRKMAGEARSIFDGHPITDYKIKSIERPASAKAVAIVDVEGANNSWQAEIHFVKYKDGVSVCDWEEGVWVVMQYAIDPFRQREE